MYIKGASEIILESCKSIIGFDGNKLSLDSTMKQTIENAIANMANSALRTIIIAKKTLSGNENMENKDNKDVYLIEKDGFDLILLMGIKDVLRKEVPDAIAKCKKAGVRVRMVTGDNLLTARAIAKECGIISPDNTDSLVMNGLDFINAVGGGIFKI